MRRIGRFFLFLLIILNAPIIYLPPWENVFFDKQAVIEECSKSTVEVKVSDLEATGVYVPMTSEKSLIVGANNPNWFHRRFYAYAQFYIYYGDDVWEPLYWTAGRTSEEDDDPWVVLIADSIIDIPDSGTVELDLSQLSYSQWNPREKQFREIKEEYGIKYGTRYIDCASPYCEKLQKFKDGKETVLIYAIMIEILLIIFLAIVSVIVDRAKKRKNPIGH